ncbi:ferroportin1 (FPN1) domain-containing protein [Sarocladium implicatum]|nr:ferroportin1 (FPN1) domain-containing protein [Sarocladium implicatum]
MPSPPSPTAEARPLIINDESPDLITTATGTRSSRRLYTSHFLSTWNSRVFEFGAVLYLAAIFPGTLLPLSVYALVRGLSAMVLAPAVGRYIDTGDRLSVVRTSIVFQRLAVAVSCVLFYLLSLDFEVSLGLEIGALVLLTVLACSEKLSSIMNLVSVEKDWVVVVAGNDQDALRTMNAQMRRIDLLCKLFGPLFIALLDGFSTRVAILTNLSMNIISVTIEYFAIAQLYHETPALQQSKQQSTSPQVEDAVATTETRYSVVQLWNRAVRYARSSISDHAFYLRHPTLLPSFALALLSLTVLSFGGQMTTYLLSPRGGFTSTSIGITRTVSVAFEILATWAAPWLMSRIGPVRAGLWMSSWQIGMLAMGVMVFWKNDGTWAFGSALGLVGGTVLSRLGLFGFDLCMQVIVQEEVEPEHRGRFSTVEAVWQNAFELLSFSSTIIFHRPSDFRWPVLISLIAVAGANVLYSRYVRSQRGHLIHLEAVKDLCGSKMRRRDHALALVASRSDV